jgi:SNF2 family DNA or RNA helicase
LRPYQNRGAGWLAYLERWNLGGCLADDMGLGKTPQCLAFLLNLKEQQKLTRPILLICPTSVLGNWEREAKRFAPSLRTYLHYGPDRLKSKALAKAVADKQLVLTSYALLQRDLKTLQTVNWQGVVLDEAQNIKNPETQQSKAARELAQGPEDSLRFRMALTGTPVENRLSELWSIMEFLNPGHLGPRNYFQRRFILPIERYGDNDSLRQLRGLVQPFILRRLKTDRSIIADLPDKQEMTVYCGLTEEQAALYERSVNAALSDIEIVGGIQRRGRILALLTKLKQICNHPSLLLKQEEVGPDFSRRSAKLQRLDEMLAEVIEEGDRALIFTQFAEAGKLLQQHLRQELQQEVLLLTGATKKGDRETMVDRFQQDPQGPPIFILSLKAGGVGLNLTRANHVFHFDRWWNPAVENQATDRAFRIGQRRNVQVHKFVCSGTLEEKIDALIQSKQALAEQIVGSGEDWLTELSADQLRDLLILDRSAIIESETELI